MNEELSSDMVSVNRDLWERAMDALKEKDAQIARLKADNEHKRLELIQLRCDRHEIKKLKNLITELADEFEPTIGHWSDDPERKIALVQRAREAVRE